MAEVDPAADNHKAREAVAKKVDEVIGEIEDQNGEPKITDAELNNGEAPGKTKPEKKENVKEQIEELVDEIHAAINRNDIEKADKSIRALRKKIKKFLTDKPKRKNMLKKLVEARKLKRGITEPVITATAVPGDGQDVLFRPDESFEMDFRYILDDDFALATAQQAAEARVSALRGVSEEDEKVLGHALDINTVSDLATHPFVQWAVCIHKMARLDS